MTEGRDKDVYHIDRLDFPRVSGEDVASWLFQCEHYFDIHNTPEEARLKVATIHLEGKLSNGTKDTSKDK